jgi:hypothetical protein
MEHVSFIGISVLLVLTGIGPFYAYRCWKLWRHTNITGISVEVTKDKSFLSNNFKLVLVVGALSSMNVLFNVVEHFDLPSAPFIVNMFYSFYYLNLAAIMSAILILAIAWHKLLSRVNRWDKRWIR